MTSTVIISISISEIIIYYAHCIITISTQHLVIVSDGSPARKCELLIKNIRKGQIIIPKQSYNRKNIVSMLGLRIFQI